MRVGFFLSSHGGSPLVGGLERGLRQLGHEAEPYDSNATYYDLILIFNQGAHTRAYVYPEFPKLNCPVAFVDTGEYGWQSRLDANERQYANAFAPGSMTHDTKNHHEQTRLKQYLEGKSFPYFLREYLKAVEYPLSYHPIDYPLYHLSVCDHRPDRDEYLRRSLDLFCWWGHSHPWREHIAEALRGCNTKCEIGDRWSDANLPQEQYFGGLRRSKCSVSFDGYGSGSFRVTEVLVRTVLLMGPLKIHRYAEMLEDVHCILYDVKSDGEQFVSTNIGEKLRWVIDNPEVAFEVYQRGYDHCQQYYSEVATARYLLSVVEAHDWTQVTQVDIV